ncbi:MAG: peptidase M26, partial [Muribaculaceae bacterium]|nr:peptidase M26 [Muribaculaceae bacterium]
GDDIAVNTPADVNVVGGTYESGAKSALGRTVIISSSNENVATVTGTKISFVGAGTATITYTTTGDAYVKGATYTQTFTVTETNYNIATAQDLLNIKYNTEGDYKLTADIDMSGVTFSPLPDFTGSLDGQGHVIRNLTFNNPNQDQAALFATTHGATIKNLGIENANIVGNANAAAIVGRAYGGNIQSCYVANSYIEGRDHVGSIAGDMNVNDNVGVIISDCLSDAKLKTRSYQVGGLVGVTNGGTIQNCYFSGTIDGNEQWSAGVISLIDSDDHVTIIQNNLSAASHLYKGSQKRIVYTAGRNATMINNHAVESMNIGSRGAAFSGTSDAAGSEGETVDDATAKTRDFYVHTLGWDFDKTWKFLEGTEGKMYPVLSWMNAPLPTEIFDLPNENTSVLYSEGAEFLDLSPIHGSWGQDLKYNITDGASLVSTVDEEPNKIYVGNEDGEFVAAGNVTVSVENSAEVASLLTLSPTSFTFYVDQSDVTTDISTPEQFASLINRNLSGKYQLVNDIDMSSYDGFKGIAVSGTPFSGTLDGQGHKVSGLTVTYTDGGSNEGIFGQTAGATIKNIAFENILVDAGSAADHVGFIGSASNTTFDQVAITGKVIGDDHVALLAGDADGITVTNTTLWGIVDGRSQCGGFAGCTLEGGASFDKCLSNVNVSCSFRGWAGGFVGLIDKANSVVSINNCVSLGDMSSAGDGTPRVAAPFIAGNGAGDAANAVINFNENNLYNSEATITADNIDQAWPS